MTSDNERLHHMLAAIREIEEVAYQGREAFLQSRILQNAALYSFIVIGEAANGISNAFRQQWPEVAWRRAVRYRNFVIHAYASVGAGQLWDTIENDIPLLKQQLTGILA